MMNCHSLIIDSNQKRHSADNDHRISHQTSLCYRSGHGYGPRTERDGLGTWQSERDHLLLRHESG